MACLGRMHEESGCTGRSQCRGDLAGDMPRFAEPRDDDAALGVADEFDGLGKRRSQRAAERGRDCGNAVASDLERAQRGLNGRVRVCGAG